MNLHKKKKRSAVNPRPVVEGRRRQLRGFKNQKFTVTSLYQNEILTSSKGKGESGDDEKKGRANAKKGKRTKVMSINRLRPDTEERRKTLLRRIPKVLLKGVTGDQISSKIYCGEKKGCPTPDHA